MQAMRDFLDTHDRSRGTFPAQLSQDEFEIVFAQYETSCQAEGVAAVATVNWKKRPKLKLARMYPDGAGSRHRFGWRWVAEVLGKECRRSGTKTGKLGSFLNHRRRVVAGSAQVPEAKKELFGGGRQQKQRSHAVSRRP
jgi:hypothetical protein